MDTANTRRQFLRISALAGSGLALTACRKQVAQDKTKETKGYSESGVTPNTLVAFAPKTRKFQTWPIPSGGGVVRNMVATPDDKLYLACSGVNKVWWLRSR